MIDKIRLSIFTLIVYTTGYGICFYTNTMTNQFENESVPLFYIKQSDEREERTFYIPQAKIINPEIWNIDFTRGGEWKFPHQQTFGIGLNYKNYSLTGLKTEGHGYSFILGYKKRL